MRRGFLALGAVVVLLVLASLSDQASFAAPYYARLYGTLCVDSSCGPENAGLEVVAKISGVECGSTTSTAHTEQNDFLETGWFDIQVSSAGKAPGCGAAGSTVEFYVDGRKANETSDWFSFDSGMQLSVGDYAYYSGGIQYGDDYYSWPCFDPCNGPLLKAFVGDSQCGELHSVGTDYHSYYRWLIVAGADAKPGCAHPGDNVSFTVDGVVAHEQTDWYPGFEGQTLTTGPRSHYFTGHACVYANCSFNQIGLPVVAKIGGVVCGETETDYPISDGIEQSLYTILVAPVEKTPGCGTEGATIDFYIDGRKTRQTATWTDGGFTPLALWTGPDFAAFSGATVCNGKPCYNCFSPCATATIQAYIGDEMCGQDTPYGWLIGNSYGPLIVLSNEQQAGCGTPGATVHFKINNLDVAETATWTPGFSSQPLTGGDVLWGDTNCSRSLDAADALRIIADNAGTPVPTNCFNLRQILHLSPFNVDAKWGDFDCSGGDPTLIDAVKLLAAAASGEPPQESGCPPPAAVIQGYPVFAS